LVRLFAQELHGITPNAGGEVRSEPPPQPAGEIVFEEATSPPNSVEPVEAARPQVQDEEIVFIE
jgi:hypothetical protein